ncbi:MAG TPA: antiviral reverse transcriptase Drt2 [Rhodanobacter sp.]|nr:antiviral reverse transcriptase Drt2 [Rhodanobacter sp.]
MANDPLRLRGYLHIDKPPTRSAIAAAVSNPERVAQWSFFPLITNIKVIRKLRRKGNSFVVKEKRRSISYASHRDAALYAYYAEKLTKLYEQRLRKLKLDHVVTAFRTGDGRCNIHFAHEAFEWIDANRPCVALAYDISGFFDNLEHQLLRRKWCDVLSTSSLPPDHYALYRSLTRFSTVQQVTLYATFGISMHAPKASGRERACTPKEFRERIVDAGYLQVHQETKGIPQGTPLSAVLSNIYMLDFDEQLAGQVNAWGGLYRRYCDDVLCIVPPDQAENAKSLVESLVNSIKLEVQPEKLEECLFGLSGTTAKPALQYLGLTYDGRRVRLRSGGVARFYNRLRKGVRKADRARTKITNARGVAKKSVPIKRGRINRSYLYVGPRNFVSYAARAARITHSPAIRDQIARRAQAINEAIQHADETQ